MNINIVSINTIIYPSINLQYLFLKNKHFFITHLKMHTALFKNATINKIFNREAALGIPNFE